MAITNETGSVVIFGAAGDASTLRRMVRYLRWINATTAGHQLVVKDTAGNTWFESTADGAYFIDIHPVFSIMDGIVVETMGSGKLYVYVA